MGEQLTIFGLWEQVAPQPVDEQPPAPASPPPSPIDPRQVDLLSGPQALRAVLGIACEALDADGLRAAHAALNRKFIGQQWADRAPAWADMIEWLVGREGAPVTVDDQVDRALAIQGDAVAHERLPEITSFLLGLIRGAPLVRAATCLTAERGPSARLPDGRPAGYLLLLADEPNLARASLEAAVATDPKPDARTLGYLGEAAWRDRDERAALRSYARACVLDPDGVDTTMLTCEPIHDLLAEADERELPAPLLQHVPVMADLLGRLPLDDHALDPPPGAGPARQLVALLRDYRQRRAWRELDDAARIAAKREMLKLAPRGLRDLFPAL